MPRRQQSAMHCCCRLRELIFVTFSLMPMPSRLFTEPLVDALRARRVLIGAMLVDMIYARCRYAAKVVMMLES